MKNNQVSLHMLYALSSILLVSNSLYAMMEIQQNVKKLLKRKSCQDCNLHMAFLSGENLGSADLQRADLRMADLYRANLYEANLEGADLRGADLRGANLYGAKLNGANLYGAKLEGANFEEADLNGAFLYGANLAGVKKGKYFMTDEEIIDSGAFLDEKTTLPSGEKYEPTRTMKSSL